ncbi:hypothetical protein [Xanthomarina sp. F2636L]|uniref:hypothetical protein n=1 Tax=Xanthomarina sp. F2636L TaxID=2996018 RepID=UPI00225E4227|nr:hypothetical protein [Xanthomarina sp. F2636L]MCX7549448.1 hypothetical protein [Xanthomarina sp. F2636L]
MSKTLTYPFGTVSIHNHYLVAVMNEGITVKPDFNLVLEEIVEANFKNKNFVYITHRIHSYSVDPNVYFRTSQIPNLIGFAVVIGNKIRLDNIEVEKMFLSKPLKSFKSLNEAINWAETLINNT